MKTRRLAFVVAMLAAPTTVLAQSAAAVSEPLPGGLPFVLTTAVELAAGLGALVAVVGLGLRQAGLVGPGGRATALYMTLGVAALAALATWLAGSRLMYAIDPGALLGRAFPWSPLVDADGAVDQHANFFRSAAFAALAAAIAAGAVAERTRLWTYFLFATVFAALIYPIAGSWTWGGGYLAATWGFVDQGGAAVVHIVGGAAALAGALVVGARAQPTRDGLDLDEGGLVFAGLGALLIPAGLLPTLAVAAGAIQTTGDVAAIARIFANAALAGGAGAVVALVTTQLVYGRIDAAAVFNAGVGGVAALAAAPADPAVWQAAVVGGIAGVIVTLGAPALDRAGLDDATGAAPTHFFCGVFGALIAPWWREEASFFGQFAGVAMTATFAFTMSALLLVALRYTIGLRTPPPVETSGLDAAYLTVAAHRHADLD